MVVVTGGNGMVGHALRTFLPDAVYLTRKDCDLEDFEAARQVFTKLRPTVVVHLAAMVGGIVDNVARPYDFVYKNLLINTHAIQAALEAGVGHFVACSSTCAYPGTVPEYPMHEGQFHLGPPAIENLPYGYAKRVMAVALDAAAKQYGIKATVVYPSNLYGPHDTFDLQRSHFVPALIMKVADAMKQGWTEMPMLGTGRPLRQFLYVDDLASAIYRLVETGTEGHFNVATPENLSIEEIAAVVMDSMGCKLPRVYNGRLEGQYRKDASSAALLSVFPDFPFTPLRDGVAKTCDWYLRNRA